MKTYKCCVSSVEIVSPSIDEMITINIKRFREFYATFINTVGQIALQHGCEILAPLGDGFKFSFPQKSKMTDVGTITNVLECLLEQLKIGQSLSIDMGNAAISGGQELRDISCRICTDYETLSEHEPGDEIELVPVFLSIDRIRSRTLALANTIIVGDQFYKEIQSFPILQEGYHFERKDDCVFNNVAYPLYQLSRRARNQKDLTSKSVTAI